MHCRRAWGGRKKFIIRGILVKLVIYVLPGHRKFKIANLMKFVMFVCFLHLSITLSPKNIMGNLIAPLTNFLEFLSQHTLDPRPPSAVPSKQNCHSYGVNSTVEREMVISNHSPFSLIESKWICGQTNHKKGIWAYTVAVSLVLQVEST